VEPPVGNEAISTSMASWCFCGRAGHAHAFGRWSELFIIDFDEQPYALGAL
jgi:hypothetical protein